MLELERHLVRVDGADGATLEVFAGGAGQPVVCTAHPFYVAPSIVPEYLVEVPGLVRVYPRGVGGSSPAGTPHERTMVQTSADLEAVRRWRGVNRWVFSGASAGGFLGLRYALRYPKSLAGLILHACAASRDYVEHPGRRAPLPTDRHQGPDGRWVYTGERETPFGAWRADMTEGQGFDVRKQLGTLRVPTLILCGRHDPIVAVGACTELHALLPSSDLVVLEHSEHGVAAADDATYRTAVHRFLIERVPA